MSKAIDLNDFPEELKTYVRQKTAPGGRYADLKDYLFSVVRRDYEAEEAYHARLMENLQAHLLPAMTAPDDAFEKLGADDIKRRARLRFSVPSKE